MNQLLRIRASHEARRPCGSAAARGLGLATAAGFLLATAPGASAATTTCGPDQTISDQTINGSVVVPANTDTGFGEGCNLVNVTVNGSVTVLPGGELDADNTETGSSVIRGALIARQAFDIDLFHLTVYGATLLNGVGSDGSIINSVFRGPLTIENTPLRRSIDSFDVTGNTIGGSLVFVNNAMPFSVADNHVTGNVQINGNTGGTVDPGISNNTIRGVLSCARNALPFFGSGNTAVLKRGQCSTF